LARRQAPAFAALKIAGLAVRVLNPRQGTFHPKLYVSRRAGHEQRRRVGGDTAA
jgi:hypothetical protein